MNFFTFEPGDGCSYRIIFDQVPGRTPFVPFYFVIGIAEGSSEPGSWYAFDAENVSYETFCRRLDSFAGRHLFEAATIATAYRVFLALLGRPDSEDAAADCPDWRDDWRRQLPPGGLAL